jgi:3-hydroxyisobutyrate dehydrogenase-like beta-hydroxyacid dehydrogenase
MALKKVAKKKLKVGFVGCGEMGEPMAGHVLNSGKFEVHVFDINPAVTKKIAKTKKTAKIEKTLASLGKVCDVFVVMVGYDDQVKQVVTDLAKVGKRGAVIVITATSHPDNILECAAIAKKRGMEVIDAPVAFGLEGARNGTLASTVGGSKVAVNKARPVLECYSRAVYHLGELGSGELGKTMNNMLHWAHSIANYEALLLGKVYGLDAQQVREMLCEMPATNGTLRRWDGTRFTWQGKDMDIAMDLAQKRDLPLPFFGMVDQMIKWFHADDVAALLYKKKAPYMGKMYEGKPISSRDK